MASIRFASNGPAVLSRIASSTAMANAQLQRQQGLISRGQLATIQYAEKMRALRAQQLALFQGFASRAAVAGFAGIAFAVTDAAKLQQILTSIRNTTNATAGDMERFYNASFAIGDRFGITAVQAANLVRTTTRGMVGQFTNAQILQAAPNIAAFASVLHQARPDESIDEAAKQAISIAHTFRQYDPKGMTGALDAAIRMGEAMPDAFQAALTQFRTMGSTMQSLGVNPTDAMAIMTVLSRVNMGTGRGGTNVRALLQGMLPALEMTKHAQTGKRELLRDMGLVDASGRSVFFTGPNGSFEPFKAFEALGKWAARHDRQTVVSDMKSAFGVQGANFGQMFTDPAFLKMIEQVSTYMKPGGGSLGLGAQMKSIYGNLSFQFGRAVANLSSVMTELGYPWLNDLTRFFRGIADNLHGLQMWLHSHRDAEKQIGAVAASLTAIFAAFVIAVPILGALRVVGLGEMFASIGRAFSFLAPWAIRLAPALLRLVPGVGWVLALVTALWAVRRLPEIAVAIYRWWAKYQDVVGYTIGYVFGGIGRMLVQAIESLGPIVGAGIQAVWQNLPLMLIPGGGGGVELGNRIASALQAAIANTHIGSGPGFGASFMRGMGGAYGGGAYTPPKARSMTYSQPDVHLHLGAGSVIINAKDGRDAGEQFMSVVSNPQHVLQSGSALKTSSTLPRGLSVGNAVFGM